MQKMKKYLLALLLLTSVFAVAVETEYVQFAKNTDFNVVKRAEENWDPAAMISLNVQGGSIVYLTNYTSNFNELYDIGDPTYVDPGSHMRLGFDMTKDNYGYREAIRDSEGKLIGLGEFHSGTGEKIDFTFPSTDPNDPRAPTTPGYFLGEFDKDTEIFFYMTPLDNNYHIGPVDTYNLLSGQNLQSRQINTVDQLGRVRVNLAPGNDVSHEFAIASLAKEDVPPSGQPLPGVLTSCLVALGATGIAARRRKQSRK